MFMLAVCPMELMQVFLELVTILAVFCYNIYAIEINEIKKMTKKLIVSSNDVEEWNGVFLKHEIELEMRELDQVAYGNDWIVWVLDHMFDDNELPTKIESFILACDELVAVKFKINNNEVMIEKA